MPTVRRALTVLAAGALLLLVSPVMLLAAIGIKLTSPGPVLYRSKRIGRDRRRWGADDRSVRPARDRRRDGYRGAEFTLYKFRTTAVASRPGAPITSPNDSRIFPVGALLRATKIDELPQLINVIKGDMTFVGPRPEMPEIVQRHYTRDDIQTLQVTPGVTSPGTLYYYTHFEPTVVDDATDFYAKRFLPTKLAIERVYIERATLTYDASVLVRTLVVMVARLVGWKRFPDPPEIRRVGSIEPTTSRRVSS